MKDAEIARIVETIRARPRATEIAQMRRDNDARGLGYGLAPDVTVRKVDANGVRAEWTSTPDADGAPSNDSNEDHDGVERADEKEA